MRELDALLELLAMLASDVRMLALFALLGVAAVSDWRSYRIPNWLTFGGASSRWSTERLRRARRPRARRAPSADSPWASHRCWSSTRSGIMGAGDVKLMAMVGRLSRPAADADGGALHLHCRRRRGAGIRHSSPPPRTHARQRQDGGAGHGHFHHGGHSPRREPARQPVRGKAALRPVHRRGHGGRKCSRTSWATSSPVPVTFIPYPRRRFT
jgi:hypothetical protein